MKIFKITKRSRQTGEDVEYYTDNFTKFRKKYGLDEKDEFRRGIEKAFEKNNWYAPRKGSYDWRKEIFEITDEEYINQTYVFKLEEYDGDYVGKEENKITVNSDKYNECANCGKVAKYSFRNKMLCNDCYSDNDILMEVINNSFTRKTNLEKIQELEERRVLFIGDLHAPFDLEGYFDFCKYIYRKHNCNVVVFSGDVIDMHYSSYHESDPDGMGAGKELELAKKRLNRYYNAFPNSLICIGNHDKISSRKALTSGLSSRWIKTLDEILDTPNWTYGEKFTIDGITYCHGVGGDALSKLNKFMSSHACGHYHQKSFVYYKVNMRDAKEVALQIGCGCDEEKYAFAYGRDFGKMQINVGVVLDNGKLAFIENYYDWKNKHGRI